MMRSFLSFGKSQSAKVVEISFSIFMLHLHVQQVHIGDVTGDFKSKSEIESEYSKDEIKNLAWLKSFQYFEISIQDGVTLSLSLKASNRFSIQRFESASKIPKIRLN